MNNKLFLSFSDYCVLSAVVLSASLLIGCGDGVPKVMGSVTVDGQPVEQGSITFIPVSGKDAIAGAVIKDGKYETKVATGKSKVEIRVPIVVGQERLYDTPDSPTMDVHKELLPDQYHDRTKLEIDVVAGTNQKDWELEGKKKRK